MPNEEVNQPSEIETRIRTALEKKSTRGEFLKQAFIKGGKLAGAVAIGGTLLANIGGGDEIVTPQPDKKAFPDLLTEQELNAAHIHVYQTPDVKLLLRAGIFDFPLFQDAKAGKIKGVHIALVDHPNLAWRVMNSLPDDVRFVYQEFSEHPSDRTQRYWENKKKDTEGNILALKSQIKQLEEKLVTLSGELYKERQAKIKEYKGYLKGLEEDSILTDIPKAIAEAERREKEEEAVADGQFIYLNAAEINRYEAGPEVYPEVLKRRKNLVANSKYGEQVYIYICVGGEKRPSVADSHLRPEQFKAFRDSPWLDKQGNPWGYRWKEPTTVGKNLRHEVAHYGGANKPTKGEYATDTETFEYVKESSDKGDDSGYPFVFLTQEGYTVTTPASEISAPVKEAA